MAYIEKGIYPSTLRVKLMYSDDGDDDDNTLFNDYPHVPISALHFSDNLSLSLLMTDPVRAFPVNCDCTKASAGSFWLPSCLNPPQHIEVSIPSQFFALYLLLTKLYKDSSWHRKYD